MSESASTSSSLLPEFDFGGTLVLASGDGWPLSDLCSVLALTSAGEALSRVSLSGVEVLLDDSSPVSLSLLNCAVLSCSRFSKVPRSVAPRSSSDKRPDSRSNDSMRPNRFSRPSMYFALTGFSNELTRDFGSGLPLGRIALLLDLGEDAFCLVVLAMGARGHLPIALDFLLSTHIASLKNK
jgi:hypothetical protein